MAQISRREQNLIAILPALRERRNATASDLGVPTIKLNALVDLGYAKVTGSRKHVTDDGSPRRGRPQHTFAVTDKGRRRAASVAASAPLFTPSQDADKNPIPADADLDSNYVTAVSA